MSALPLEVRNVYKTYGSVEALKGVSLKVEPGQIFGLLGPNGAGKTTLISILVTLEQASRGEVEVFGHAVAPQSLESKRLIGHVPQELIAYGYFNVEEILQFYSGYYGLWRNQKRIDYLLDRLSLSEHRHKKVKQLSGGMKRRLLIAKALLHAPKLLLLDEPTAGVDLELRSSLWSFVRELQQEGMSILLTTHYIQEAEELCDRVAILQKGQIKIEGPTQELVRDLTKRELVIQLREPLPAMTSPFLTEQTGVQLIFHLPKQMPLGELLSVTRLDPYNIVDMQIREGTLEDALRQVLGVL